jgi:hypothetical protein
MATAELNRLPPSRRRLLWYLKQCVRFTILALVIWGIWRAAMKAQLDLATQQAVLESQIGAVDRQLEGLSGAAPRNPKLRDELLRQRSELVRQRFVWSHVQPGWTLLAGLFYFLSMLPCAWFWQRTMRALGQRPRWRHAVRAYTVGNLGKYVPGKALVVVLRASLIRGRDVALPAAAAAIFVETLTMMAAGAVVAAVLLLIALPDRVPWPWIAGAIG